MSLIQFPNEVMSFCECAQHPCQLQHTFNGNKYTYHSITVKPMSKSKVYYASDIDDFIFKHIPNEFEILYITYEQDSSHVLHAHILARTRSSEFTKIKPVRYWHVYNEATDDIHRYMAYIMKHNQSPYEQERTLIEHYAYHNNLFNNFAPD